MAFRHSTIWASIVALFLVAGCGARSTGVRERDVSTARTLVADAEQVLEKHLADKSGDVLRELIRRAKGMMIVPSAGKAGFVLSFGGGSGVLMANTDSGWTGPVIMTRSSLGWGWQVGVTTQSGIVLFMHEEDVRYVMETGAVLQGEARLVFLSTDYEYGKSPEFQQSGDIYFVGNRSGLFAGVAFDTGGYADRPALNEALSGVAGGDPENILFGVKARPEAAARLREIIGCAALEGVLKTKKDGTEVPSN